MPVAVRTRTPPTAISSQGTSGSPYLDADGCRLLRVEAPACSGGGSTLPGRLGLRTIENKRGVIETTPEQAFLTFPRPGGYKILWEPGALHLPLTKAPSGHLCLELDHFYRLDNKPGVPPREMTLLSGAAVTINDQQGQKTQTSDVNGNHQRLQRSSLKREIHGKS